MLRRSNPLEQLVGGLSFVASGVLYPPEVLPDWLRVLGELLPLTALLSALRGALLDGDGLAQLAPRLGHLAAFTAVLAPLGALAFARALKRARDDGSLGSY